MAHLLGIPFEPVPVTWNRQPESGELPLAVVTYNISMFWPPNATDVTETLGTAKVVNSLPVSVSISAIYTRKKKKKSLFYDRFPVTLSNT